MIWLAGDWIWLALGAAMIGFLLLGWRGCAMGQGGHEHHMRAAPAGRSGGEQAVEVRPAGEARGHRREHGCC